MNTTNKNKRDDFIQVIDIHKGIIYKIAHAYCKDRDDQEDLIQEIIIRLWENFERYDPKYKITTWMYRISLNMAISHYRKTRTRKKHTIPMEEKFVEVAEEKDDNKEADIKKLQQFIQQLDKLNRAMMILFLDGNSHSEIAEVLNISKSNVGTKIGRIKEKLKKYFNQK